MQDDFCLKMVSNQKKKQFEIERMTETLTYTVNKHEPAC